MVRQNREAYDEHLLVRIEWLRISLKVIHLMSELKSMSWVNFRFRKFRLEFHKIQWIYDIKYICSMYKLKKYASENSIIGFHVSIW